MQLTRLKGRTHLLRSPGRPLLLSPLENLAQILHTKPRISAAEKVDKERDMGPDTTSLNITPTHHTHAHSTWRQIKEHNQLKETDRKEKRQHVLMMALTLKVIRWLMPCFA